MLTDPLFYAVSIPAVLIFGIAKGGLGVAAVPSMSLVVSPVQAAGILLPILCLMDLLSLWAYRGKWAAPELRVLIPASMLGILAGTLLFGYMSIAVVKLIIGIVAALFISHYQFFRHNRKSAQDGLPATVAGCPWRHSGGVYQLYCPCRGTANQYVSTPAAARPDSVRRNPGRFLCRGELRETRPLRLARTTRDRQPDGLTGACAIRTRRYRIRNLAPQARIGPAVLPVRLQSFVCRCSETNQRWRGRRIASPVH